MKKVITFFLVAAMVFGLVALSGCGDTSTSGETTDTESTETTDTTATETSTDEDYILIGRVVPLTGILASFGDGSPDVEQKAIDAINEQGGIYIEEYGKKLKLKLVIVDSESDTTTASEAATKLVTQDNVDILTASHTPLTVCSVSAVAERYEIPCVTVECPADVWLGDGDHYWSFHSGFTIEDFCNTMIDEWDLQDTNKTVGLLMDNQDGASFQVPMTEYAEARGYTVIDPGLITVGTNDYTSMINEFKAAGVEIITGNMNCADFTTCWNQFQQTGYLPKVVTIGRAALFPANAEAIGNAENISTEVWWSPTSSNTSELFGVSSSELGAWYEETTGNQCSAVIGYKYANMEIVIDALQRAQSLDPQTLRDAIAETDLDTIIGHTQYNEDNWSQCILVGGQWVPGETWAWEQNIVVNTNDPGVPLSDTPMGLIPGSE